MSLIPLTKNSELNRARTTLLPVLTRSVQLSKYWLAIAATATGLAATTLWSLWPLLWATALGLVGVAVLLIAGWVITIATAWTRAGHQLRAEAAEEALRAAERLRQLQQAREEEERAHFDSLFRAALPQSAPGKKVRLPWEKLASVNRARAVVGGIRGRRAAEVSPAPESGRADREDRYRWSIDFPWGWLIVLVILFGTAVGAPILVGGISDVLEEPSTVSTPAASESAEEPEQTAPTPDEAEADPAAHNGDEMDSMGLAVLNMSLAFTAIFILIFGGLLLFKGMW